jgi:hypothetical protein
VNEHGGRVNKTKHAQILDEKEREIEEKKQKVATKSDKIVAQQARIAGEHGELDQQLQVDDMTRAVASFSNPSVRCARRITNETYRQGRMKMATPDHRTRCLSCRVSATIGSASGRSKRR